MSKSRFKPKIGLVLGSGASRGWSHIGLLEFHKAAEAIEEGERCVHKVLEGIHRILELV